MDFAVCKLADHANLANSPRIEVQNNHNYPKTQKRPEHAPYSRALIWLKSLPLHTFVRFSPAAFCLSGVQWKFNPRRWVLPFSLGWPVTEALRSMPEHRALLKEIKLPGVMND